MDLSIEQSTDEVTSSLVPISSPLPETMTPENASQFLLLQIPPIVQALLPEDALEEFVQTNTPRLVVALSTPQAANTMLDVVNRDIQALADQYRRDLEIAATMQDPQSLLQVAKVLSRIQETVLSSLTIPELVHLHDHRAEGIDPRIIQKILLQKILTEAGITFDGFYQNQPIVCAERSSYKIKRSSRGTLDIDNDPLHKLALQYKVTLEVHHQDNGPISILRKGARDPNNKDEREILGMGECIYIGV